MKKRIVVLTIFSLLLAGYANEPSRLNATIAFAVIGDFGFDGIDEARVAALVKSWKPDFILTVGDNNYVDGAASTMEANIGKYYAEFIYPYTGAYTRTATINRFFPTLGNHDWHTPGATPYLNYFTLPNNERYYDFVRGPVHFFALDSDPSEPDGIQVDSRQAMWLKNQLAASTSCWNVVYFHHAPYSSGLHGSNPTMQWQFQQWGADAVLAGHDHTYERILHDGIPYFVNGLGGFNRYAFDAPVSGSAVRYNSNYGALNVGATETMLTFQFINVDGVVIDTFTQRGGCGTLTSYLPLIRK
jgi:hypothetical protein